MTQLVTDLKRSPSREEADYEATLDCGHVIPVSMTEFYDLLIEMQDAKPDRVCPVCEP